MVRAFYGIEAIYVDGVKCYLHGNVASCLITNYVNSRITKRVHMWKHSL